MRSAALSAVRQITSSRQSPRMSAESAGVDLVPLFDMAPVAVNSRSSVDVFQFHFAIQLLSRISRSGSASHQTAKFVDGGAAEIRWPWTSTSPMLCLLYTSDAADERSSVDLGGRRIIKKKKK